MTRRGVFLTKTLKALSKIQFPSLFVMVSECTSDLSAVRPTKGVIPAVALLFPFYQHIHIQHLVTGHVLWGRGLIDRRVASEVLPLNMGGGGGGFSHPEGWAEKVVSTQEIEVLAVLKGGTNRFNALKE